jgi:excisionase family DNA binding protein
MPAPASTQRRYYRVAELARLLDVDPSTVYRMIYTGLLEAERHGPRRGAIRVPAEAFDAYLAAAVA